VQLVALSDPDAGEREKLTVPVGVRAPPAAVSLTVATQVTWPPTAVDCGEHPTIVDVGSLVEAGVGAGGGLAAVTAPDCASLAKWLTSPP
jgi:hypothetical protein